MEAVEAVEEPKIVEHNHHVHKVEPVRQVCEPVRQVVCEPVRQVRQPVSLYCQDVRSYCHEVKPSLAYHCADYSRSSNYCQDFMRTNYSPSYYQDHCGNASYYDDRLRGHGSYYCDTSAYRPQGLYGGHRGYDVHSGYGCDTHYGGYEYNRNCC